MQFNNAFSNSTRIGAAIVALTLQGCGSDVPPAQTDAAEVERQHQAFIEAMKPRREGTPLVAVLAVNEGTEMTDFLLPHAVLQRSGVVDVQAVAPRRGLVSLYPTLQVEVPQDLASFDQAHPSGADYVIVPAMNDSDNPAITGWLKQQADKGARIIGICAGGLIVGRAGLLDDRRFVTHWYFRETLQERHPSAVYVPHQRYVVDGNIATTAGITASVPTTLALIEAIGGWDKAQVLANQLGVNSWSPAHDSSEFGLTPIRAFHFILNKAAFWRDENWSVDVQDGTDDIALALVADAWSRTEHITVNASAPGPIKLHSGIVLAAQPAAKDDAAKSPSGDTPRLPLVSDLRPVQQLDRALCEIEARFGDARREWVMMEMEYPNVDVACAR